MCPHCGYNFTPDVELQIGPWSLSPNRCVFDGVEMGLTPGEAGVLFAIARGKGSWITSDAILNRISDSDNTNVVAVLVSRMRKKLGQHLPFESAKGRSGDGQGGYRWNYAA